MQFSPLLKNQFILYFFVATLFGCDQFGHIPQYKTNNQGVGSVTSPATSGSDATEALFGDVTGKENSTLVNRVGGVSAENVAAAANSVNSLGMPLGTAATRNVGTGPGNIALLDSSGRYPALDGSQITNLTATNYSGVLGVSNGGTGAISAVAARTNLGLRTGATFDVGVLATNLIQLDGAAKLPGVDGSLLTNLPSPSNVGGVSAANIASGANAANAGTNVNTPSTLIKRDASGNFSAGTITGTLVGNASTATQADFALGKNDAAVSSLPSPVPICSSGSLTTVTGNGTITSFAAAPVGAECTVLFSGNAVIRHNAASTPKLILNGAGPFTTSANDVFRFLSLGGGDWLEIRRTTSFDSQMHASLAASSVYPPNTQQTLILPTVVYDRQNEYNSATGIFTAKQAGIYTIVANAAMLPNADAAAGGCFHLALGGVADNYNCPNSSQFATVSTVATVELVPGQAVSMLIDMASFTNNQTVYIGNLWISRKR